MAGNLTITDIRKRLGGAIVLLQFTNSETGEKFTFKDTDLPPVALTALVAFINLHLPA
jgi:hypothetical protein